MPFQSPVGSEEEIASGAIWPGRWFDATPYLTRYSLGYHTGADLNLNYPHWDLDRHSKVFAIGPGTVTYAQLYSRQYWGNIVVIDHGMVDGLPLVSRYGHVENIRVAAGAQVQKGAHIANVGNGEGLFPYHLHFDISRTDELLQRPGHWPGSNIQLVRAHYVDPKEWLQAHAEGAIPFQPPPTQVMYIIATIGLRVRQDHSRSSRQVGSLPYGARVTIDRDERETQDGYIWGHLYGGNFHEDWIALGSEDQTEVFVSPNPPGF
jgi:murein DD-endopeptidase MepM/ murein hydrolase activator NlpD